MRGTGYAIAEIIWWLLAAGAIGFLLGWIVRTWGVKKRVTDEYEQTLAAERARSTRLESELATRQEAVDQGQRELQDARTTIEGLEAAAAAAADAVPTADPAATSVLAVPDDTLIAPASSAILPEPSPATPPDQTQTAPTLFDMSEEATPEDATAPPDQQPPPVT